MMAKQAAAGCGEVVETVETWRDILGPAGDRTWSLLAGFIALAMVELLPQERPPEVRRRWRSPSATWDSSRASLVSVVDLFAVADWNLPVFEVQPRLVSASSFFVLASTVLWGALYCGRICAFGALTQLMDAGRAAAGCASSRPARLERRAALDRNAGCWRPSLVVLLVAHARRRQCTATWSRSGCSACSARRRCGSGWPCCCWRRCSSAISTAGFSVRSAPLLGVISNLTVFQIKRWSECNTCKICEKTCEWGAIRGPKIVKTECVRCDDCERLYLDQQKCPHWLHSRSKVRPSAAREPLQPVLQPRRHQHLVLRRSRSPRRRSAAAATSAIPFSGPSRKTPGGQSVGQKLRVGVRIVTLRQPACDGSPVLGSMMWW